MTTRSQTRIRNRSLIEKLPVEMQLEIFSYLDPWSIRRCSEACSTFFQLTLRPEFKKNFGLVMSETYLAFHCDIGEGFTAGRRTERTFDCLTLKSMHFEELSFAKNFFMRLGKEITELHIEHDFLKWVVLPEFKLRCIILKNFPNLKKLVVQKDIILQHLQYFPPSLKQISVQNLDLFRNESDFFDLLKKKGASGLEKLVFSKVKYLVLPVEKNSKNAQLSNEVFEIIHGISPLIRSKSIETNCNTFDHTVIEPSCVTGIGFTDLETITIPYTALKRFPNLQSIDLVIHKASDRCFKSHNKLMPDFSHIKKLKLKINRSSTCEICMSELLTSFTGLTHFEFNGALTEEQVRLIFSNMPKLEHLELAGRFSTRIYYSAEHTENSLEQLKNLQSLYVYSIGFRPNLCNNDLFKFSCLPNLKNLQLGHNCEDDFQLDGIQHLVQKCPNISSFCTSDAKINGEMLREMLRSWPRLHTLSLPNANPIDAETLDFMKENCRFLSFLRISSESVLTNLEQSSLMEKIPLLRTIKRGTHYYYTRTDFFQQNYDVKRTNGKSSAKRKREETEFDPIKRVRLFYNQINFHPFNDTIPKIEQTPEFYESEGERDTGEEEQEEYPFTDSDTWGEEEEDEDEENAGDAMSENEAFDTDHSDY